MESIPEHTVLVTGGVGYIGSHTVLALKEAGYNVIVIDNLSTSYLERISHALQTKIIVGDITDRVLLDDIFSRNKIDAVIHFAGLSSVEESFSDPDKYYHNNVYGSLVLLEAMKASNVKKFVFASSCAIYGVPCTIPVCENHAQNPISPYGTTKLLVEKLLLDFDAAYGFKFVCFRFFNAAGADPKGRLGEEHKVETHLIPLVLQAALGKRKHISIYGTDYAESRDGTCVRDYIHVSDLARAHVLGMEYLLKGGESKYLNLGNESGYTVKQVIETAKSLTGETIHVVECDRRPGDPPNLQACAQLAMNILGWKPKYGISHMIEHAWEWYQKHKPREMDSCG